MDLWLYCVRNPTGEGEGGKGKGRVARFHCIRATHYVIGAPKRFPCRLTRLFLAPILLVHSLKRGFCWSYTLALTSSLPLKGKV